MNAFFLDRMAMYAGYHLDPRNRATHFVGVPVIAFALLVAMARLELGPASLAAWFFVAVSLFYLWLDWRLGLATALATLPLLALAEWSAGRSAVFGWTLFLVCFVGGWAFQLWGHAMEGRRPALLAPIFLVSEVAFALGLRRGLRAAVDRRA